ncbi:hypothetical protein [Clostridium perfringens]|uniref:hypothetical protein n=1 Tax=Clostridium perfringens TaxID=1502 RepID=UPI00399D2E54
MKKKHSKALLVSAILAIFYCSYIIGYFLGGITGTEGAEQLGASIATAIVMPHIILVVLATIFNWVAYFSNKRGFALTAGILFSVAGVVFLPYIFFVIPSLVLSFVGYAKLKTINEENAKIAN